MAKKGDKYKCEECGLVVVIEDACECGDECVITCCEKPMKKVTKTTKTAGK